MKNLDEGALEKFFNYSNRNGKFNRIKLVKGLTDREFYFANEYLKNQCVGGKKVVKKIYGNKIKAHSSRSTTFLRKKNVRNYIIKRLRKMEEHCGITLQYKLSKLKTLIDVAIPDDTQEINTKLASQAVSAISELNRMQGHYSPEKSINFEVRTDADIQEAEQIFNEILEKHKKEY